MTEKPRALICGVKFDSTTLKFDDTDPFTLRSPLGTDIYQPTLVLIPTEKTLT